MVAYQVKFFLVCINVSIVLTMYTFSVKKEHLNKGLIGYGFSGGPADTIHRCVRICKAIHRCKSVNFRRWDNFCELNYADSSEVDISDFEYFHGGVFSDMTEWLQMRGGCEGSTCGDNEACYPIGPTHECILIENCNHMCIPNGSTNDTSTKVGTYLKLVCDNGYFLAGNPIIHCMSNGYWSDYPFCY